MLSLIDLPLQHHTVLLRVDFNVPLHGRKILDESRIKASVASISYLLKQGCTVVLISHFGRPKGREKRYSLSQVLPLLKKYFPKENITFLKDCIGERVRERILAAKEREIFLLENLRFYDEEVQNSAAFAHSLASLADFYVNDAFSVSHRKHASLDAITNFLPSAAGFSLETELLNLKKALQAKKPRVWILGGAKLQKLLLLNKALEHADKVLVGGKVALAFLRAKGYSVGQSPLDQKSILRAKKILKDKRAKKLVLPIDFLCARKLEQKRGMLDVPFDEIPLQQLALDIGPKTAGLFEYHIRSSGSVLWNGPLGYAENPLFTQGSKRVAKTIAKQQGRLFSLAGGGETSMFLHSLKLREKFSYVSLGGGASLSFLSGEKLPALMALEKSERRWKRKERKRTFF